MAPGELYCSLITPVEEWTHWSDEAEGYHQISRHTLFQHGKSIEEVADDVNRLLKDQTVYSDGWVVDQPWLIRLFHQARKPILFRISPLEMILSEAQMETVVARIEDFFDDL